MEVIAGDKFIKLSSILIVVTILFKSKKRCLGVKCENEILGKSGGSLAQ